MSNKSTVQDAYRVPAESWGATKKFLLGLAVVGLVASGVGLAVDSKQFFHSYMTAYMYTLTIALGCLFFVMLQHITRSGWSVTIRRLAEIGAWTLPFFVILFIPVLLGMGDLFHWTDKEAVEHDHLLQHKKGYLNLAFFLVRAVIYFLIWTLMSRYFLRRSLTQDTTKDPMITVQMQSRAAPGIIVFGFTLTFMAFDWLMSMDPHWYSTIFGVYIFSGAATVSFAFLATVATALRCGGFLVHTVRVDHFQDLGRWMFSFAVFWTYIAFSQFFLIWYGNIPEETIWYVHRMEGSWKMGSLFLAVGHFAVPLVLLMSRWIKRKPGLVTAIAVWMLLIHYWDIYWIVMPNLHHDGIHFHWLDVACLMGVLGVFLTLFTRKLAGHALVPVGDPRLPESLALEHLY